MRGKGVLATRWAGDVAEAVCARAGDVKVIIENVAMMVSTAVDRVAVIVFLFRCGFVLVGEDFSEELLHVLP